MPKASTRDNNKAAGLKSFIGVLKPIRDWLKNTPPIVARDRSNVITHCSNGHSNNHLGSLSTINGSSPKSSTPSQIVHTNHLLGKGLVERTTTPRENIHLNPNLVRQQQNRMSLPLMQQHKMRRQIQSQSTMRRINHHPPPVRSMGHIYLQYKGETKQSNLPNEITAIDTIWALFVCAFPTLLTMEFMSQPHVKIYIYNPSCNIFYELRDIDDIKHESVMRIHQSDPQLALPQQYQTMRLAPPQIPPPKPRRMIPVVNHYQHQQPNQNPQTLHASSNSLIYGMSVNHASNPSPVTSMQFQSHYNTPHNTQPQPTPANQYQQRYIQQHHRQQHLQQQQQHQQQQQNQQQQLYQQASQLPSHWSNIQEIQPAHQQRLPLPPPPLDWTNLSEVQPSCLQLSDGI